MRLLISRNIRLAFACLLVAFSFVSASASASVRWLEHRWVDTENRENAHCDNFVHDTVYVQLPAVHDTVVVYMPTVHDTLVEKGGVLSRYDRNALRYRRHWDLLIPTDGVMQICGNMGIVSLGIGWQYGKRKQWETQLLFGFIPRFDSDRAKFTMTLKENFIPWRKSIGKGWYFEPLECSFYFNTVFGHDFWTKQPTKYESGYYPFSTRIRPNLALGERFKLDVPHNKRKRIKSITFFYEIGTNDIYFMRFYRNGNAPFWDVFGLSVGAKVQYL